MFRAFLLVAAVLAVCGCGVPRDAAGTLAFVHGGTMRVGVVANRPWVIDRGATVEGVEGWLASNIAAQAGARIEWVRMPEFELMRALKEREIQLAIGGFVATLPWAREVAFSRPYLQTPDGKRHVLAAPPGENAWLMLIDRQIEAARPRATTMLAQVTK
jgi:hypothetical protein